MNRPSVKLAVLGLLAVVFAMAAAATAFNAFVGWKVETDAVNDIEYALDWSDEVETGRMPGYFLLDSSYHIDAEARPWSAKEEVELAAWFAQHPDEGVVSRVQLDDWACYAAIESTAFVDEPSYDEPYGNRRDASTDKADGYLVAYIDITGEQSMIACVNGAFAAIAIIGALLAALAGHSAGRRIEQAQEVQKRFYENMSHELKTPLAAIRGYAEGAGSGVVAVEDAVSAIERESDKMSGMIEEILGLSRIEAGAVELHRETVDVGDFVQDCLMPFEGAVRTKGLQVDLDLAPGTVEADPDLFERAFSNIISNAVRHADHFVRVSYDGTRLAVVNDGDAPDADQVTHLFDRFYVAEGGSTGIGLAITREIAAQHGWNITARLVDDGLEIAFVF